MRRVFVFIIPFLILSFSTSAQYQAINLALIDSSLCLSAMDQSLLDKLSNAQELQKKTAPECQGLMKEDPRPYHAQFVLETFLAQLNAGIKVHLTHFNVFTNRGVQDLTKWRRAISPQAHSSTDLILMTTGGLLQELHVEFPKAFLETPTFISSGQVGPGIALNTILWPHEFIDKDHSYLKIIGADEGQMLYQEKISSVFSGGKAGDSVRGSSRAAALAAAESINRCALLRQQWRDCFSRKLD
jgi:hypothetical protein